MILIWSNDDESLNSFVLRPIERGCFMKIHSCHEIPFDYLIAKQCGVNQRKEKLNMKRVKIEKRLSHADSRMKNYVFFFSKQIKIKFELKL